ncbi:hypothetical protein AX774_g1460 [Zancudomyces culisetae]|uniref:Uncharacterized protein n=1 Tax=Zancudomyces culisetae TaxID=1213189 RepID=A0A1R1PVN3_ZANCU|nr:hypothetical protein AX774_g1460 [Zancudomyces culisetae]|eukprot:OMH85011.1 hypothetical protein AX774_g1460 [Zancudomyces culisetae]
MLIKLTSKYSNPYISNTPTNNSFVISFVFSAEFNGPNIHPNIREYKNFATESLNAIPCVRVILVNIFSRCASIVFFVKYCSNFVLSIPNSSVAALNDLSSPYTSISAQLLSDVISTFPICKIAPSTLHISSCCPLSTPTSSNASRVCPNSYTSSTS